MVDIRSGAEGRAETRLPAAVLATQAIRPWLVSKATEAVALVARFGHTCLGHKPGQQWNPPNTICLDTARFCRRMVSDDIFD